MKKLVLAISAMLPALWAGAAPYAIQHVEPMNW
jgi:neopullulanase